MYYPKSSHLKVKTDPIVNLLTILTSVFFIYEKWRVPNQIQTTLLCADISLCEFNLSLKCKLHISICDRLCLKST